MHEGEYATQDSGAGLRDDRARPQKQLRFWHYCMLVVPFVGLLCPPLYARWTPELLGIPFFYAYQFIWILLSSGITALVYWSISR